MDEMKQIVARNLRRIRHERKLSQEELSFRAKVDRSYISQLETGSYSASVTMLGKLAKALGIDVSELLKR
ncbi:MULTISPECIES: helix-turn-helix domain-containing protein [Bradyrhizobium]|jgi:transcriptional regulator with XRE-family HTH domain|uniref:helix-turn-helix domain-containing protein n=1 Tax=Bradyrhizobium TaxID=374 RepID=UPI00047F48F9|nr:MULTISPECIES: helix-turn-helix transcriptional regulator [Bradyrhizobium]MCS3451537.1 transcriptional regulator with XRE-family HTH domain [Bradyrhizobium elkanii]MCS3566364.1 transcriptional regulator with XRE-family HTH domain [Bradyrhizobium elkanii]MCW2152907.1 transcriptional regulator with XRE-family HTH domain [Bradyrhizobium elkanii]MCW2357357.1 transcriptional regulator with XRE-family HTH domain [Bradyrhizobium elkanii]MCW2376639.1 transcriptional regulator with XRE-family HTH dom